jgi:hypothetical protein
MLARVISFAGAARWIRGSFRGQKTVRGAAVRLRASGLYRKIRFTCEQMNARVNM